ncbi:hypothetical protein PVK06_042714 [Gossypium arboreum]|uniref:Uncharacterized protein n=1 Tax=Gossypium arboreum TaxID=29729 RepID=A0ABR0MLH2_GOSAR|nr:hypothetical protein PVK06_042714 [Gossypium arboreum]
MLSVLRRLLGAHYLQQFVEGYRTSIIAAGGWSYGWPQPAGVVVEARKQASSSITCTRLQQNVHRTNIY